MSSWLSSLKNEFPNSKSEISLSCPPGAEAIALGDMISSPRLSKEFHSYLWIFPSLFEISLSFSRTGKP